MAESLKDLQMGVTVSVLGCGDAFASGGRLHACFYVRSHAGGVLIDCGATVLTSLARYGVPLEDIDTVLISHFHGDHYGGLPFLLLRCGVEERRKPLTIVTPPGGERRVTELLALLYPDTDGWKGLDLRFMTYPEASQFLDVPGARVAAYPVVHTPAACPHGLRIEIGDRLLAYSGDTAWTPVLATLAQDADLFICECNFYGLKSETHLDYATFVEHEHMLSCKRVLLTHWGNEMLARAAEIKHELAREGMQIVL